MSDLSWCHHCRATIFNCGRLLKDSSRRYARRLPIDAASPTKILFQSANNFGSYLTPNLQENFSLERPLSAMATTLDNYDLKLLREIQRDAHTPQSELATRVNLSPAAVNRRLRRLADEGVIDRYTAVLAPEKVGYPLTIVSMIEVESEQIDLLDGMKRTFAECPQIQQCYYVAGEWDFVVIFSVRHMEEYNELTRSLFFANNNVKRFKTLVSMSRVKVGLEIPIVLPT